MKAFLLRLLQSCNPNTYSDLADEKLRSSFKHFFKQFLLLFVIMAVLFVPAYFIYADTFAERLDAFATAELDGSFTTEAPVTLTQKPNIIFDRNATSVGDSFLVFGQDAIYYKPYVWFGESLIRFENLKSLDSLDTTFFSILAILLLPALIFWSGVFVLVKMLVLIHFSTMFAWLIVPFFKHRLKRLKALQVGLYAAVPALIVEMILFPFWRNVGISLIIYLLFFIVGVALVAKRKVKK